jgi:hypothetical protein
MNECTKCKLLKPRSEFFVRDAKVGRLHTQCKICYKVHRVAHYASHYKRYKALYIDRAKKRNRRLRLDYQTRMLEYLSDKACLLCDENDIRVLEFDHLVLQEKKFTISQAVRLGYPWDKVIKEIQKCRILCANCHKKRTAAQFNWYKS